MAVTLCADELADILDFDGEADDQAQVDAAGAAIAFATALMTRYMGGDAELDRVPATICNNAVLRVCGWFREAPRTAMRILSSTQAVGDSAHGQYIAGYPFNWSVDHSHATANPLRSSGAMALLSPYKRRRAIA